MNGSTQDGASRKSAQQDRAERALWDDCDEVATLNPALGLVGGSARSEMSRGQMGWLLSTIETEIIPRLVKAHRVADPLADALADVQQPLPGPVRPRESAVEELAQIILANHAGVAAGYIDGLRADGVTLETLYLDVLTPAARRLGELWEADLCDFTQVTIGLLRLQQLMYELSPAFQDDAQRGVQLHRAMLVPVPGSHHTLGLLMVAEFFRRAGWGVWGDPAAAQADLVEAAQTNWFDMVGFSVGAVSQLSNLKAAITAIRRASLNPSIVIMVGGPVFLDSPALVAEVGADATAPDAALAVEAAMRLIPPRDPSRWAVTAS